MINRVQRRYENEFIQTDMTTTAGVNAGFVLVIMKSVTSKPQCKILSKQFETTWITASFRTCMAWLSPNCSLFHICLLDYAPNPV